MSDKYKAVSAALGAEIPFKLITARDAVAIHDDMVSTFGGTTGVRDRDGLMSAVGRQLQTATYGECSESAIAASLAYGLCQNHAFLDGNKRTAFGSMIAFLSLNGVTVDYDPVEAQQIFVMLAAGEINESELSEWIRSISEQNIPSPD